MKRKFQRGQATIELCAMLIALAAMILGIVVLSGFYRNSHKILLEARHEAQKQAAQGVSGNSSGTSEILDWDYSNAFQLTNEGRNSGGSRDPQTSLVKGFRLYQDRTRMKNGVDIPFALSGKKSSAGDTSTYNNGFSGNTIGQTPAEFDSSEASAYTGEWEKYVAWRKNKDFDSGFTGDFTGALGSQSAYDAADLTQGKSTGVKDSAVLRVLYSSFERWFGTNPRKLDLHNNPGNIVYMPHYGSEQ